MKVNLILQFKKSVMQAFIFITLSVTLPLALAERLTSDDAHSELNRIEEIRYEDSAKALGLLTVLAESIDASSPVSLRRKYLSILVRAYGDSGAQEAAWDIALELEAIGVKYSDEVARADGLANQGSILISRGKFDQAIAKLNQAVAVAEAIVEHDIAQFAYSNLASAENSVGDFKDSIKHYLKALDHTEHLTTGRGWKKSALLNNISLLYMSMKDPQKGLEYNELAFEEAKKIGSKSLIATLFLNRGYAYDDIGRIDEAFESYLKALDVGREINSIHAVAVALINISDYFLRKEDYQRSEEYGRDALAASINAGEQSYVATANANIGMALAGRGLVTEGAEKVVAAIEIFEESNSLLDVESTLNDLARLYDHAGMYKEAFDAITRKMIVSERLYKSDRDKSVAELQEKFNAVQSKKRIESLEIENRINDFEIENLDLQHKVTALAATLIVIVLLLTILLYQKVKKTNRKLEDANSKLQIQSISDPLTGLLNRRSFLNLMKSRNSDVGRRSSMPGAPNSLILLDVDNFKQVNDNYGHAAGDVVLIEISRRLKMIMRETDMILRWGGEEFLVFSKDVEASEAKLITKKILDAIGSKPICIGDKTITVTVSVGGIPLPFGQLSEEEFDWSKALKLADMALYLGKVHGRNRGYFVDKILEPYDDIKENLEKDLAGAMENNLVAVEVITGPEV